MSGGFFFIVNSASFTRLKNICLTVVIIIGKSGWKNTRNCRRQLHVYENKRCHPRDILRRIPV